MDRKVKEHKTQIIPSRGGWRLRQGGGQWEIMPGLEGVAEKVRPGDSLALALPTDAGVFERMRLPSADAGELAGMVRLQIEKTLPFPPEEITSSWMPIRQEDNESVVLGIAFHKDQIDATCAPLIERELYPDHLTVWAAHVASRCPENENVLAVYREGDRLVLAGVENRRLGWVESLTGEELEQFPSEFGARFLAAELEGVPTNFSRVMVAPDCADMSEAIQRVLPVPIASLPPVEDADLTGSPQFMPDEWRDTKRRGLSKAKLRHRLAVAGAIYLIFLVVLLGWLVRMQLMVDGIDRRIADIRPQVEQIQAGETLWRTLSPAIDPALSSVEILHQIMLSLPDESVRVTALEQSPDQILIEGEAPSANLAIQFTEKIKNNTELAGFAFESDSPTLLPNEHAKFRIFGRR